VFIIDMSATFHLAVRFRLLCSLLTPRYRQPEGADCGRDKKRAMSSNEEPAHSLACHDWDRIHFSNG
jgi:hypothetical protein